MVTFADLETAREATEEECWDVFDNLPAVTIDELTGWRWKGYEIETGNPLNGTLDEVNWFGKEFYDENKGHPLLTYTSAKDGDDLWPLRPLALFNDDDKDYKINDETRSKYETKAAACSLKTIRFRGVVTASMFYDDLPINDTFRKVDENTVFGVMDYKYGEHPLFFYLEKYKPLEKLYSDYKKKPAVTNA